MIRLCVVILNYRTAELTGNCLASLAPAMGGRGDRQAVVVDNASGDGSAGVLEQMIRDRGWSRWARVVRSPVNGGFAAGNNVGFRSLEAEAYLLLNSDALVTPGSLDGILASMDQHPTAGLIGPRLQGQDGQPQVSCFNDRNPIGEMLDAAGVGVLDRLFRRFIVPAGVHERPVEAQWVSFACVLVRGEVIRQIGPMDEDYFMYFEDIDYCRRARKAGWKVLHDPRPRVIHLRGGSSSVKSAIRERRRVPRYYYEARSRYFGKFYGGAFGVVMTNLLWLAGRSVSWLREKLGRTEPTVCAGEGRDNWVNWRRPVVAYRPVSGGEI